VRGGALLVETFSSTAAWRLAQFACPEASKVKEASKVLPHILVV